MTKQELNTLAARFEYMLYLEAGLKEWKLSNKEEESKIEEIKKSIDNYLDYLSKLINKELDKKEK